MLENLFQAVGTSLHHGVSMRRSFGTMNPYKDMPTSHLFLVYGVLALVLAAPDWTLAWSPSGHEIVCEIAWQKLTAEGKNLVKEVRSHDTDGTATFAESCVWPDEAKKSTHKGTYEYHFVNVPRGESRIVLERDCPAYDCVPVAIHRYGEYLQQKPSGGREKRRRANALRFLGHFVGDIHQPLHAGYREDYGGNLIKVKWFGKDAKLHAVWDGEIAERGDVDSTTAARELAAQITPAQTAEWQNADVLGWAQESFRLAKNGAYEIPADGKLGEVYFEKSLPVVRQQFQKAGVRLAFLINSAAEGTLRFFKLQ